MKRKNSVLLFAILTCLVIFAGCKGHDNLEPSVSMAPRLAQSTSSIAENIEKPLKVVPTPTPMPTPSAALTPTPTPTPAPTPDCDPTLEPTDPPEELDPDYIANMNTGKFHYPDCPSVDRMREYNKYYFIGSRDELIDDGYVPCKRCDP